MQHSRIVDFLPPRQNPFVLSLIRLVSRFMTRLFLGIYKVEVSADDISRLQSLLRHRAMLLPNHPMGQAEPAVMFEVVRRVGFRPFFIAAREVFEAAGSLASTMMQRLGCYSIRRGMPDRPSMEMTRKLLVRGRCLVAFPEGECYGLNDVLLPFHNGIAQMAFWAVDDLQRMQCNEPLYLIPLGIRYIYLKNMSDAIGQSLGRMEAKLNLSTDDLSDYQRLRRIGEAVVTNIEKENGLKSDRDRELPDRIESVRQHLITKAASQMKVNLRPEWTLPETLRALFNAGNEALYAVDDEFADDAPEHRRARAVFHAFHRDLTRLFCFVAVKDDYVASHPTTERYCDMLCRLEREVLGLTLLRGPRKVVVRVGEPINLQEHYAEYRKNKRKTVAAITQELEKRVGEALMVPPLS